VQEVALPFNGQTGQWGQVLLQAC